MSRRRLGLLAAVSFALIAGTGHNWSSRQSLQAQCGPNPIVCENLQAGAPASEWDISGSGDSTLQGFATDISVNKGQTVHFKVSTTASQFNIDIYRLGYYGGFGARKVASILNVTGVNQVACLTQSATTGLIDCGNWSESSSWLVPSTATSGIYIAKLTRSDTGGASHIVFIVRDDTGASDILFQTSDTTWQAYNNYGGNSLYVGSPGTLPNRAYKVSYNRPFITRTAQGGLASLTWLLSSEYAMVRWLEANGYHVSYFTGVDVARRGTELTKHRVFVSVGHDEYWSAEQRASVEAARSAGVHLAFFSGNEIFWKTRWETSIDGSGTAYRTMVSYKETHQSAKIDPLPAVWTGTWRDPRFSPPADGGQPENALTGTIFAVNCCRDDTMSVSSAEGKLRFWRNTSIATLAAGTSASFPGLLGHEWDVDAANGVRPAGLLHLSTTTVDVGSLLLDYGNTYGAGTATHSTTLYRHSSGALIFAAGSMNWPLALETTRDKASVAAPDIRIQQATVNLFGDMEVQPGSMQAGLTTGTPSTDTVAPSSMITTPVPGASVVRSSHVTVSGTATDSGGGSVAAVEVSVDDGSTWSPASGTTAWTYQWTPDTTASVTLKSRAIDDSGNIGLPSSGITVIVLARSCPCSIWTPSDTPATIDGGDVNSVELGLRFRSEVAGNVTGIRFYKGVLNTSSHVGSLWTNTGTLLSSVAFTNETASGWQEATLPSPVAIAANTTYVVSYHTTGHYSSSPSAFTTSGEDNSPLYALATGVDGANGVFLYGAGGFPDQTYNATNYWVDVVFAVPAPDTTPPTVTSVAPANGTNGVTVLTAVTATFNEPMNAATISSSTVTLRTPASTLVPATVSYNAGTRMATLVPNQALAASTVYTATVSGGSSGVSDSAGNTLTSNYVWSFTTGAAASCPCSIWSPGAAPAQIATSDSSALELGVRFRADASGTITGVRFYKGVGNTGTHTGSLWTNTGTLLATATFTGETASGWQQVSFGTAVSITAGTTYVASYHTNTGNYGANPAYFAAAGVDNVPLHALATGVDGANGLYRYGPTGFPDQSYNATNYWVDVVFVPAGPDTTPPTVTSVTPTSGASGVSMATSVTATFNEPMNAATITTSTVTLRAPANTLVPATVSYNSGTRTATLVPNQALAASTVYTATVSGGSGGVADSAGNTLTSNYVSSFTTGTAASCPCTIWNASATPAQIATGDSNALELGVRFRADAGGTITGVRFYKGVGNTGTHTGSLWTNTGALLATATFTGETASGWQQVSFGTPVAITAGTTYVASYHTNTGNYGANPAYFAAAGVDSVPLHALATGVDGANGVFLYGASGFPNQSYNATNYWVDVVFLPSGPDTTPPVVSSATPTNGATGVNIAASASATFNEPMNAGTITTNTVTLRNPANALVPATVSYDGTSRTATLVPTHPLAPSTTYTATVAGGSGGVADTAGNTLAGNYVWSFTTGAAVSCPCSIWTPAATPAVIATNDPNALELGVRFRADVNGTITGVRFYKGAGNTGTHTGSLWTNTGTLLRTATFTGETASGWQQVTFATPVAITAGTTFVVSYHTNTGNYGANPSYFAAAGADNGPLHALATGVDGANGLYLYGAGGFPNQSYNATNYWVDVVFVPSAP